MRCCSSDWALFVWLLSTLVCCQPTELIFFYKFSNFTPPPSPYRTKILGRYRPAQWVSTQWAIQLIRKGDSPWRQFRTLSSNVGLVLAEKKSGHLSIFVDLTWLPSVFHELSSSASKVPEFQWHRVGLLLTLDIFITFRSNAHVMYYILYSLLHLIFIPADSSPPTRETHEHLLLPT